MLPRNHRTAGNRLQKRVKNRLIVRLCEFLRQVKVIPANDAILDQPLAAFGDFLFLLLRLNEFPRTAHRYSSCESMGELDLVELALDRLAQFDFVDVTQDENRLGDLAESFQRPIQRVLLGVGVETPEDFRGSDFLELDRGDQAEDLVPVLLDQVGIDIARRRNFPLRAVDIAAGFENVELLALQILDLGRIGKILGR